MKKIKIQVDPKPLESQEIRETQNFEAVLNKAGAAGVAGAGISGIYYWILGAAGVAVVAAGLFFWRADEVSTLHVDEVVQDNFALANPARQSFWVDTEKGGRWVTTSGTEITIPESAFILKGEVISDSVEVRFREFHDPAHIFLAGISMVYDSAGTQYHFETAGMFEFEAFLGEQKLDPNPDQLVQVSLRSTKNEGYYNRYYYKEEDRSWEYHGKDTTGSALVSDSREQYMQNVERKLLALSPPEAPDFKLMDEARPGFLLDVKEEEFPAIFHQFDAVRFELIPNANGEYDLSVFETVWESVRVEEADDIELHLLKDGDKKVLNVLPSLNEKDWAAVKHEFEEKMRAYKAEKKALEERKKHMLKQVNETRIPEEQVELAWLKQYEIREQIKEAEEQRLQAVEQSRIQQANLNFGNGIEGKVMRNFQLVKFGVWNSDCPRSLPKGEALLVHFVDEQNKTLEMSNVFLVELDRKALYRYTLVSGEKTNLTYNPKRKNTLWGVTKDKRLALMNTLEFSDPNKRQNDSTLVLRTLSMEGWTDMEQDQLAMLLLKESI